MLELRPTCENCNTALPPAAEDAMICSFECTFCTACVRDVLRNVCPNCGGGFERRPVRPSTNWRHDNDISHYPPSAMVKHRPTDPAAHLELVKQLKAIPPAQR